MIPLKKVWGYVSLTTAFNMIDTTSKLKKSVSVRFAELFLYLFFFFNKARPRLYERSRLTKFHESAAAAEVGTKQVSLPQSDP